MPTLPVPPEPPAGRVERTTLAMRRVAAAAGADARVTTRALIFMVVIALGASMAPAPWAQLAIIALVGLALDWARTKRA